MRINVDQIEAVCRKYEGCDPSYFVGDIPAGKSSGARRGQKLSESEQIIALVDFTVLGGARESLVITDQGLAWKNTGNPERLSWEDLVHAHIRQERSRECNEIYFDNELFLALAGTRQLNEKGNEILLQLLTELQALDRSVKEEDGRGPDSKVMEYAGLEECEFCGGLIKPEVTFCKYCGIKLRG